MHEHFIDITVLTYRVYYNVGTPVAALSLLGRVLTRFRSAFMCI